MQNSSNDARTDARMEFVNKTTIKLSRILSELDKLVLSFVSILKKHTDYAIVSGYVAIILGRNRATDDVDIIVPAMDKTKLKVIYEELIQHGYWCLNSSIIDEIYDLLVSKHSVRFAIEPEVSPNFEIKFSKNVYDAAALQKPVMIMTREGELKTSILELQIAYKEEVLKSNKDIEDAYHIRSVAEGNLNEALINEYKRQLKERK